MEVNINEKFEITQEEKELVIKYRENPEMQAAVNKILNTENAPAKEQPKPKKGIGVKIGICVACWMIYVIITVLFSQAGYYPGGLVTGLIAGILAFLAVTLCKTYDTKKETQKKEHKDISKNIDNPQPEIKITSPEEEEKLYHEELENIVAITMSAIIIVIVVVILIVYFNV